MRYLILTLSLFFSASLFAAIDSYSELITRTSAACRNRALFNTAFTNDVVRYKSVISEDDKRNAADLAIALFLINKYDKDFDSTALTQHNQIVSNIVYDASINNSSWIRYAAGFEYINGLNMDNDSRGLILTTNLIAQAQANPPTMEVPNYWDALMDMSDCSGASILDALRLNAAIELYERGVYSELSCYTNSLPIRIYQYYLEEIE